MLLVGAFSAALSAASSSFAAIQVFYDKAAWEQAVGSWTTVDSVQPQSTFLTDQYADVGLLFPLGDAIAGQGNGPSGDGWALFGASPDYNATLQFTLRGSGSRLSNPETPNSPFPLAKR
mgnify:CR=1 FL=1